MTDRLKGRTAIVGLGLTQMGRVYDSPMGFAVEAVRLALADAGLERSDLDGLLLNPGIAWNDAAMGSFALQQAMGLRDMRLSSTMNAGGATAAAMVQHAALAIDAGLATTVACVFSDAPLKPPKPAAGGKKNGGSAAAYGFARGLERGVRPVRRQRALRVGRPSPHGPLRDHQRRSRRRRRRRARLGEPQSRRPVPRHGADARRLPPLALDRRAVSSARLLSRLERRRGRDRHRAPSVRATCASRPSTSGASVRVIPAAIRSTR